MFTVVVHIGYAQREAGCAAQPYQDVTNDEEEQHPNIAAISRIGRYVTTRCRSITAQCDIRCKQKRGSLVH